jgi:hypothetical protein
MALPPGPLMMRCVCVCVCACVCVCTGSAPLDAGAGRSSTFVRHPSAGQTSLQLPGCTAVISTGIAGAWTVSCNAWLDVCVYVCATRKRWYVHPLKRRIWSHPLCDRRPLGRSRNEQYHRYQRYHPCTHTRIRTPASLHTAPHAWTTPQKRRASTERLRDRHHSPLPFARCVWMVMVKCTPLLAVTFHLKRNYQTAVGVWAVWPARALGSAPVPQAQTAALVERELVPCAHGLLHAVCMGSPRARLRHRRSPLHLRQGGGPVDVAYAVPWPGILGPP